MGGLCSTPSTNDDTTTANEVNDQTDTKEHKEVEHKEPGKHARRRRMQLPSQIKCVCYDAWPEASGYTASNANDYGWCFGADFGANLLQPVWGQYRHKKNGTLAGRNDIIDIKNLGFTYVRLYGYTPLKRHTKFYDHCQNNQIKVFITIPNWNFQGGMPTSSSYQSTIASILENLSVDGKSLDKGYHPAIAGILFSNEPQLGGVTLDNIFQFINWYMEVESKYKSYSDIPIGIPISAGVFTKKKPGISFYNSMYSYYSASGKGSGSWDQLKERYMVCMNVETQDWTTLQTWFDHLLNHPKYNGFFQGLSVFFTEIGMYRSYSGSVTADDLYQACKESINSSKNPQYIGFAWFQYIDKANIQAATSLYGLYSQPSDSKINNKFRYVKDDFSPEMISFMNNSNIHFQNGDSVAINVKKNPPDSLLPDLRQKVLKKKKKPQPQ